MNSQPSAFELSPWQDRAILGAAARRVMAAIAGNRLPPTAPALGSLAHRMVFGAFVTLKREGQLRSCCGHVGKSVALGDALDHAAARAATEDHRFPAIVAAEIPQLSIDVWLLGNARRAEQRGAARLEAIEIGRHGVQITRGCSRGLLLPSVAVEHRFNAQALLEATCHKAGLPADAWRHDDTELVLFEGRAIHGALSPPGEARAAAHAGTFYPSGELPLQRMLDQLLEGADAARAARWAGAIVPHAGWTYSGELAAKTLSRIRFPARTIIFSPRHRPHGAAWAVMPHARWEMPGFCVESDVELAASLAAGIDGLELDAEAHRAEHAIEVQLPLIARLAPHTCVVGVTMGRTGGLDGLLTAGGQLATVIRSLEECPLLIVSSDMSHESDEEATRRNDRLALEALETRDPRQLYETVRQHGITMCGAAPAVVVLEALRRLGRSDRCELAGYNTSADASGHRGVGGGRCVGYTGMLFA
jgi:hypothetical protein